MKWVDEHRWCVSFHNYVAGDLPQVSALTTVIRKLPLMDRALEFIYPNPKPYLQLSSCVKKKKKPFFNTGFRLWLISTCLACTRPPGLQAHHYPIWIVWEPRIFKGHFINIAEAKFCWVWSKLFFRDCPPLGVTSESPQGCFCYCHLWLPLTILLQPSSLQLLPRP